MTDWKPNALAYYADFVIYPSLSIVLAVAAFHSSVDGEAPSLLLAAIAGAIFWTLVEYILHRAVLHHMAYIRNLHERHHMAPRELIDSPLWMVLLFTTAGILTPSCLILGLAHGACFTAGTILGYVVYTTMHHGMHHWRMPHGTYLYRAKRRHALHHASNDQGNFGVSTPFWDYVFGTALPDPAHAGFRPGKVRAAGFDKMPIEGPRDA